MAANGGGGVDDPNRQSLLDDFRKRSLKCGHVELFCFFRLDLDKSAKIQPDDSGSSDCSGWSGCVFGDPDNGVDQELFN
jgi:hypothetical protein